MRMPGSSYTVMGSASRVRSLLWNVELWSRGAVHTLSKDESRKVTLLPVRPRASTNVSVNASVAPMRPHSPKHLPILVNMRSLATLLR